MGRAIVVQGAAGAHGRSVDPASIFQLVNTPTDGVIRVADLVDDNPASEGPGQCGAQDPAHKSNHDYVDIIVVLPSQEISA